MTFKKLIGKLHLWLGLGSGLVVLVVSLTGCVFALKPLLFERLHRELVYVAPPAGRAQPLSYSAAWQRAQQALGAQYPLTGGTAYREPGRAWAFVAYQGTAGRPYFGGMIAHHYTVYLNPYTGQPMGILNNKYEFFQVVKWLHWGLWLGKAGEWIVGTSTLIFVLLLLSGLVLWWPKNKAARRQRFTVKWAASGKRLNYDLHNTVGFYVTLIALIIALTGLTMSFEWVRHGVAYLATGHAEAVGHGPKKDGKKPALPPAEQALAARTLDAAVRDAWQRVPATASIAASPLNSLNEPLSLRVNEEVGTFYRTDRLSYAARTGVFEKAELYAAKTAGEQLVGMNYDIHVGAILGWPTQVLAFVASLVCASLPVTGFFIWWNRLKKNKKPHCQRQAAEAARPSPAC